MSKVVHTSRGLKALVLVPAVWLGLGGTPGAGAAESVGDLFGVDPKTVPRRAPADATPPTSVAAPATARDLFRTEASRVQPAPGAEAAEAAGGATPSDAAPPAAHASPNDVPEAGASVFGFLYSKLAYTYADPEHWSLFKNTLELGGKGDLGRGVRWKASGRVMYDPVYAASNFYPDDVRENQRSGAWVWETYLDVPAGDWELRFGRQHIVWGELVGLFIADVVSARDLREFILPDLDQVRVPQWAARAEYFGDPWHVEAVWLPVMTYDEIGKPGADFYPFVPPDVPGFTSVIRGEDQPNGSLDDSAVGLRVAYQGTGWDGSLFYYGSRDRSPAYERRIDLNNGVIAYRPVHSRINQFGGTVSTDLDPAVVKGEFVYTADRPVAVTSGSDRDGLVSKDVLEYAVGVDFSFEHETRLDVQVFQSRLFDREPSVARDGVETGFSILASTRWLHPDVEPELLYVHGLDQSDWNLQGRVTWEFRPDWKLIGGVDAYGGDKDSVLGRFRDTNRVFGEVRYHF